LVLRNQFNIENRFIAFSPLVIADARFGKSYIQLRYLRNDFFDILGPKIGILKFSSWDKLKCNRYLILIGGWSKSPPIKPKETAM
jgi:hypothetical protein